MFLVDILSADLSVLVDRYIEVFPCKLLQGLHVIIASGPRAMNVQACEVHKAQWIVPSVGVQIQLLRVNEPVTCYIKWIRAHEAAQAGGVVAGAEVIKPGFGVAFLAGE